MHRLTHFAARHWNVGLVALGLLLVAPSIGLGLLTDDRAHRTFVLDHLGSGADPRPWWDLFSMSPTGGPQDVLLKIYAGLLPWWSSLELSIAFFRPLAAATHYLDYLLWPDAPALMHVHNLVWYGVLIAVAGALYGRLLSRQAAVIALLLYVVDEAHVEGASWIAGRNTLMTAFFALSTLLLYDRWRKAHTRLAGLSCAACLLLAQASSEGAVAIWAYLVAYALWIDRAPWRERGAPLLPLLGVTAAMQWLYRGLGYGARGSGLYNDPFADPGSFLRVAPGRLLTLLEDQWLLPRLLFEVVPPNLHTALQLASALLAALLLVALTSALIRDPSRLFWLAGMLGSALPLCALPLSPRLLFMPSLGAFALLGIAIVEGLERMRSAGQHWVRGLSAATVLGLVLSHAVVPLALRSPATLRMAAIDRVLASAAASLPWGAAVAGKTLYVLNTPNFYLTSSAPLYAQGQAPATMYILSTSAEPVEVVRERSDTLVLSTQGGFLAEPWSQLARRADEPFAPGYAVALAGGAIAVDAVTPDRRPSVVRFVSTDIDSARALWVVWDDALHGYRRIELPPVGQRLHLPGTAL